ncbi:MAG: type II toxin-antitoxin system VapC family toxin [Desulfuromonadaceae bacterium]|nr:type II toxin-antitoxin system VapC family toxin [Desulfuromonadaceae bacterium]
MKYLFDTNVCISYLNNAASPIRTRMLMLKPSQIVLCSVVEAELYYGVMKSAAPSRNLARLTPFLDQFDSLPFDNEAAREFGHIRAYLAKAGTPIGPYDLQIAAIALANKLKLVTHNTREFSRIIGLQLEDWELEQI